MSWPSYFWNKDYWNKRPTTFFLPAQKHFSNEFANQMVLSVLATLHDVLEQFTLKVVGMQYATFSRTAWGSRPWCSAIGFSLSSRNAPSVSMTTTFPFPPSTSKGNFEVTHIVWQICVLPVRNPPYTSVMLVVSTPPPSMASTAFAPHEILMILVNEIRKLNFRNAMLNVYIRAPWALGQSFHTGDESNTMMMRFQFSTEIITQIDKKMKKLLSCSSPSPACNKCKWMINFVLNNWCTWSQFVDFGVRKSFDIAQELERRDLMNTWQHIHLNLRQLIPTFRAWQVQQLFEFQHLWASSHPSA